MSSKDAYTKKMEAQLEEWTAEIDRMKARIKKADANARISLEQDIEDMQAKKQAAKQKLEELKL